MQYCILKINAFTALV